MGNALLGEPPGCKVQGWRWMPWSFGRPLTFTAGAIGLARWMGSQFFGVSAVSPGSYAVVALVVAAAALLATWHPARQAARVDPAVTLRSE